MTHRRTLLATLAATATLAAAAVPGLHAQTVVFSQNFNGATQNSDVTGSGGNLFDGILGSAGNAFTVSGGTISSAKTGAVSAAINRTTPISGLAGKAATFQFDFNASNVTATTTTNDLLFQVGNGYTNITGAEATATYQSINFDLQGTNSFSVAGVGGTFSGTQTIYLDLNNSGAPVTFPTPGGGTLTLANDSFTVFVGTANLFAANGGQVSVGIGGSGNPGLDITQFKLRYPSTGDNATVTVDNFLVTQIIPEPSTYALAGLGLIGLALGAVRRRRRCALA